MKFFALILFSLNVFAVSESNFDIIYKEYFNQTNYVLNTFSGEKNLKIDYLKYGTHIGDNGAVIIAVGRNEAAIKYLEVAYDLFQEGYSPIYITSHRGQGYSDRVLKNQDKGYVRKFYYYTRDLKRLYNIVRKEIGDEININMIGHSMGGAVVAQYLESYPHDIHKAAMSAPMLKLLLADGETNALLQTFLACYLPIRPSCTDYVPDGSDANPTPIFEQSDVTTSKIRFDFREFLYQENNRTRIGSSTLRWARQSVLATRSIRKQDNINKIKTPFIILQAGNELVVDNEGQDEFCTKTPLCRLMRIENSMHNILMEQDQYRDLGMNGIIDFFRSN